MGRECEFSIQNGKVYMSEVKDLTYEEVENKIFKVKSQKDYDTLMGNLGRLGLKFNWNCELTDEYRWQHGGVLVLLVSFGGEGKFVRVTRYVSFVDLFEYEVVDYKPEYKIRELVIIKESETEKDCERKVVVDVRKKMLTVNSAKDAVVEKDVKSIDIKKKIFITRTKEDFDSLLSELKDVGCKWQTNSALDCNLIWTDETGLVALFVHNNGKMQWASDVLLSDYCETIFEMVTRSGYTLLPYTHGDYTFMGGFND